ncbi:sulfurtransferase TusA family protein [Terrilactibacillus sp. S3-3]|nr:sulfurtransferase TusA family protein [Terrilactibacillus sp. S3-3]
MQADLVVDAKGLSCPMPIVKAKKALDTVKSGEILEIQTTDKGSKNDLRSWAESTGHELLAMEERDQTFFFWIKKP